LLREVCSELISDRNRLLAHTRHLPWSHHLILWWYTVLEGSIIASKLSKRVLLSILKQRARLYHLNVYAALHDSTYRTTACIRGLGQFPSDRQMYSRVTCTPSWEPCARLTLALTRFPQDASANFCNLVTNQRKTHFTFHRRNVHRRNGGAELSHSVHTVLNRS